MEDTSAMPSCLSSPLMGPPVTCPVNNNSFATPRFDFHIDPMSPFSANKTKSKDSNQSPQDCFSLPNSSGSSMVRSSSSFSGVSNCYVFKSRLQEYAQKAGISTPVYETTKEGPSHEPTFRSWVMVNNTRYDSLPGFFNRKAAEQSAAEIALKELAKSGNLNECIAHPVHETGLCKNLLQEYAQKMNYAIPSYICRKDEGPNRTSLFSCNVEIGGIQYIGAAARTKKEAEIKAARTALLAIQSAANGAKGKPIKKSEFIVVPCKKKGTEVITVQNETSKPLKPKKARFKKKWNKKRFAKNKGDEIQINQIEQTTGNTENVTGVQDETEKMLESNKAGQGMQHVGVEAEQNDASRSQAVDSKILEMVTYQSVQDSVCVMSSSGQNEGGIPFVDDAAKIQVGNSEMQYENISGSTQLSLPAQLNDNRQEHATSNMGMLCGVQDKDLSESVTEVI